MSSTPQAPAAKLVSLLMQEDPELRDIVEEFVEGLGTRLEELQQAYENLDWEQLTTLAHRLKGAGGSYGYPDISKLCAEMEKNFREHRADAFVSQIAQLNQVVTAAAAGLK
jgi:HPt (histidine-containing phosphotransfer) domain-containing protein